MSDNKKERVCPRCGETYNEFPAVSRRDNETEICPSCGQMEAFEDAGFFEKYNGKKYWKDSECSKERHEECNCKHHHDSKKTNNASLKIDSVKRMKDSVNTLIARVTDAIESHPDISEKENSVAGQISKEYDDIKNITTYPELRAKFLEILDKPEIKNQPKAKEYRAKVLYDFDKVYARDPRPFGKTGYKVWFDLMWFIGNIVLKAANMGSPDVKLKEEREEREKAARHDSKKIKSQKFPQKIRDVLNKNNIEFTNVNWYCEGDLEAQIVTVDFEPGYLDDDSIQDVVDLLKENGFDVEVFEPFDDEDSFGLLVYARDEDKDIIEVNDSKCKDALSGEEVAKLVAEQFRKAGEKVGAFGEEDVKAKGNQIELWSQAGSETTTFNDDGSVDWDSDYDYENLGYDSKEEFEEECPRHKHIASFEEFVDWASGELSWWQYIDLNPVIETIKISNNIIKDTNLSSLNKVIHLLADAFSKVQQADDIIKNDKDDIISDRIKEIVEELKELKSDFYGSNF